MAEDYLEAAEKSASFDSIFGVEEDADLSLKKFDDYWERSRPAEAAKKGVDPNQLVRFVHGGKVHWITQDEASLYLQLSDDDDKRQNAIKKEIKRAMRGESQSLSDEMSVLLAISTSTLNRYKREEAIPKSEIARIEPTLQRRFQEVEQLVAGLQEAEETIANKRKREPIFDEYEAKLGEMMNFQRQGKDAEAAALARELESKKRQYVIMSRSIEPDVYTTYFYRMELQKAKKRVLSVQKYLSSQRENSLEDEVGDLKEALGQLKTEKEQQDGLMARGVSIDSHKYEQTVEKIDKTQEKLEGGAMEMQTLEQESRLLVNQIENADEVISYISEEVLKDSGYEDAINQKVRNMKVRQVRKPPKFDLTRKKVSRMVTQAARRQPGAGI
ncbi:MAG: hypothetical protein ABIH23_12035 [bacterium]